MPRIALPLALGALLTGCGETRNVEPTTLDFGNVVCEICGMTVDDPRYAAFEKLSDGSIRPFDSIECLIMSLRLQTLDPTIEIWLADTSDGTFHVTDSMTIVQANFPSPMGKGYAAFQDAERAAQEASERRGRAGSLESFVSGNTPGGPGS